MRKLGYHDPYYYVTMKPICMHGFHIINNSKLFVLELETPKSKAAIFMMQIGSWFSFDVMVVLESVLKFFLQPSL